MSTLIIEFKYFLIMPEATIVILDNSEYSINGDYEPTRWMSQIDAAGLLIQTKLEQSHQNAMGIALSAGKHAQIICTPSNDITKVTSYLYGIKLHGNQTLSVALQTSALALKHRQNPNLSQRIICFVASTITQSAEQLKLICKKLKKNNIALDLVALGDLSEQQRGLLTLMNQTMKSDKQNDLVFVEPHSNLSDILFNTNIIGVAGDPGAAQMINEAEDPELLMALQLSLQDEEQRRAAEARVNNPVNEDDELEQRALQLSLEDQKSQKKEDKKQE